MEIKEFIRHLIIEKKVSESTADAYERDVKYFEKFLKIRGVGRLEDAAGADVAAFVLALREHGRSDATINRRISSVRAFYKFLVSKGEISVNPAADIKTPRVKRNEIEFLTVDEVEKLLEQPDETVKGIRDRALLESMYATGIKVSEVIELKLSDVNLKMGFVTLNGDHGRARIVPIGRPARAALSSYISTARKAFMKERNTPLKINTTIRIHLDGRVYLVIIILFYIMSLVCSRFSSGHLALYAPVLKISRICRDRINFHNLFPFTFTFVLNLQKIIFAT